MKKIIGSLLAAAVAFGGFGSLKIDINGDGILNVLDVVNLRSCIVNGAELSEEEFARSDVSGDGNIDVTDVVIVRSVIVNGADSDSDAPKINGISADEFVIVIPEKATELELSAADYIKKDIAADCGVDIAVVNETAGSYDHEIIVGDAQTRELVNTAKSAEGTSFEYRIIPDKTSIAVYGDSFLESAAAYSFAQMVDGTGEMKIDAVIAEPVPAEARNIVLVIGDGMGPEHVELLSDYKDYTNPGSVLRTDFLAKRLPAKGFAITCNVNGEITDSAAAATALSTGKKTANGRVGRDKDGNDLKLMTERAAENGVYSAVLSTDLYTGATPSGFTAHVNDRSETDAILESQKSSKADSIVCKIPSDSVRTEIGKALSAAGDSKFFMMYEEAYIDKYSHNNNLNGVYSALNDINRAVEEIMSYAMYHPDTVVIITADHETGGLIVDGAYETFKFTSRNHTNTNVPVFAYGAGTEIFNGATVDNTDISKFIASVIEN